MRLVIQKVVNASVRVNNKLISEIGTGMVILLGICREDNIETTNKWAQKALNVRLWSDIETEKLKQEKMNMNEEELERYNEEEQKELEKNPHGAKQENLWRTNVMQNGYEVLVISQFTLYGHTKKGNKPDFHAAMGAEGAKHLYEEFLAKMRTLYNPEKVKGGAFQQYMQVSLCNDGPVTLTLEGIEEPKPEKKMPKIKNNPQKQQKNKQNSEKIKQDEKTEQNNEDKEKQEKQQQQKPEKQEQKVEQKQEEEQQQEK